MCTIQHFVFVYSPAITVCYDAVWSWGTLVETMVWDLNGKRLDVYHLISPLKNICYVTSLVLIISSVCVCVCV